MRLQRENPEKPNFKKLAAWKIYLKTKRWGTKVV